MSILLFLAVLFVLVLVHELGHFAVAKWTGMRVDEFGIGFPPKLFGIKKGETEYTFNALPIGGFVKIFGEDGVGDPSARPASILSERSEGENQAGVLSRYGKDGADEGGEGGNTSNSFTSKSRWAQAAVLVAGVAMNVLFAWVLVVIAFSMGMQTAIPESNMTETSRLVVGGVLSESPAGTVGLPRGAIVQDVQAGGESLEVLAPSAFTEFVQAHADEEHLIAYTYNDELRVIGITPEAGIVEGAPEQAVLGVSLTLVDTVQQGLLDASVSAGIFVISGLRDITVGIVSLLADAVTFRADFSQVAGPVGIVGLVGEASAYGITALLMFTAFISLNLAVINILPFPALDGGRLVIVGIEALKGSSINPQYVAITNMIGFALLMLLMVAVTWNDIVRLV